MSENELNNSPSNEPEQPTSAVPTDADARPLEEDAVEISKIDDGYQDTRQAQQEYTSRDLQGLSDLEHVRCRPSMYIGDVSSHGLHHLVNEVVDNSLDEALAGFATKLSVTINSNGSVTVEDDGRGIPVDVHPVIQVSTLEGVMTRLKFGGKFNKGAYQTSGGLHGVGVTVVNFLSEWCNVEVCRDGYQWYQEYERGVPLKPVARGVKSDKHGTKTTFKPDPDIFPDTKFVYSVLYGRLRDLAFLNPNVQISFRDERDGHGETFHSKNGIVDFVTHLSKSFKPVHNDVVFLRGGEEGVTVEVAFKYTEDDNETLRTYVNNVHTHEGGTHLDGFRRALTKVLSDFGNAENLFKKGAPQGEDFREGVTAVIAARVPEPKFEGQTKTKLGNTEVLGIVNKVVSEGFKKYLSTHAANGKAIVQRACMAMEAREAAKKARQLVRDRKNVLSGGGLPGKLRDCTSRDVDRCELYLVEGNSAGGSAEGGRIREFQAILPLRGKVINAYKAHDLRVLKNEEVRSMITAFGGGYGGEGNMDLSKRRYGKIVIMTDADVDGSHIRTLLLTFFYRQMYDMVKAGFVYVAQPPLYRVRKKGGKGAARYVQTEDEMNRELLEAGIQNARLDPGDGRMIEGEEMTRLCRLVNRLDESIQGLEKRGFNLRELALRQDPVSAKLPMFHVNWRKQENWFFERGQLNEYLTAIEQETGKTIDELKGSISESLNSSAKRTFQEGDQLDERLRVDELDEIRSMNSQLKDLREQYGFEIDSLYSIQRTGMEGARYQVVRGESTVGAEDLRSMLHSIREAGEKGWQITRFKGLGEMDPEELRETTLDPDNRTLVQVTMEEAEAAQDMFQTLMSEEVEPRREFIERYALEASNLDV